MSTKASKWSASKKELSLKPVGTDVVQPIPQYTMAPKATPHKKNFFAQRTHSYHSQLLYRCDIISNITSAL